MVSKLRISLAARLLPIVLSVVGTVHAADTASTTQPSCNSTGASLGPSDNQQGGAFGAAVAVSGQTALVADPFYSTAFVNPPVNPPYVNGRVSVFTCDATTQVWTNTASITLPATEANQSIAFAQSVALQGDLAAVGTLGEGVYIYQSQGLNWIQVAQILPNESQTGVTEQLGGVIALQDHVLAVEVLDRTSNSANYFVDVYQVLAVDGHGGAIRIARLEPPAGDTGGFGGSLAMYGDTLVVGDPPDTTAYIYKRRGPTFRLEQTITGAEATPDGQFGTAVAISNDVILVGAPAEGLLLDSFGVLSQGAVYAFRRKAGPGSPWVETQHFSPAQFGADRYAWFGGSLAVNGNGQAVIGSPRAWDETGSEFGPTLLYTLQGGQFVVAPAASQPGAEVPATALGITDEYLVSGRLVFEFGFEFASAEITNLSQLPAN